MDQKKPKFCKLLRNNPGVYLGIFIFILFEAFVGLLVMAVLIPTQSKNAQPVPIPAYLTSVILFAIGGRGIYKYVQYKKSDDYKQKKKEEDERVKQLVGRVSPPTVHSAARTDTTPAQSTPGRPNIMERYLKALAYLTGCGPFDETKFREMNRLAGGIFTEEEMQKQIAQANMTIGGMDGLKIILIKTLTEAIDTFRKVQAAGIDLSKYDV